MEYLRLGWLIFVKMKDLTPIINAKSEAPIELKFNYLAIFVIILRSGFFPIFLDFSTYSLANSWQPRKSVQLFGFSPIGLLTYLAVSAKSEVR